MEMTNILQGVPVFIMSHYGVSNPEDTFNFFKQMATSEDWVIREFITLAFKKITKNNKQIVSNWFLKIVKDSNPNVRRFIAETLRPVSENQWIQKEPEYSLKILKNLFKEKHKYPRTSIGNNLSDLSKKNPEMILKIVKELVDMKDENSYWIAYRACRNLIKKFPEKVMDLLKVDEYHYKDRNFYRVKP
jgi:3-methyladenine DNA glycosylase AlkC